LRPEFKTYATQIIKNAQAMVSAFQARGYKILSGGTDNHLFVLDIRPLGLNGTKASKMLDAAHITISKSTLPFDTEKIMHGGGIRIGTPAITTRGMVETDMEIVADLIDRTLRGANPQSLQLEVATFAGKFMLP
jgi:glycine hydroxymethyltransferase